MTFIFFDKIFTVNYLKSIIFVLFVLLFAKSNSQCNFDINILSKTDNTCNQTNNGAINISITGSINGYVEWKNESGIVISNSQTNVSSLESGAYVIIATDTMAKCTEYKTVVIHSYYDSEIKIKNVSCPTCDDGIAEIYFTGGQEPYVYQWDDAYTQTTRKASDLEASTYILTVTDDNTPNCILDKIGIIEDCGKNLKADFNINTASCSNCNDASITAIISGGLAPYDFQWDDNANQTTALASGLDKNQNYSVVVTDVLGCQNTFIVDSTNFCKASIQTSIFSFNEPSCYDCTDGAVLLTTSGPHAPFEYFWQINSGTTDTLTNELPGIYSVKVSDSIGCSIDFEVYLQYCVGTVILNEDSLFILNEYISNLSVTNNDFVNTNSNISYIVASPATNGIVKMNADGTFSYKPYFNFSGYDFFTYQVLSDCGLSKETNVVLEISNIDMVWPGDVDLNGIVDNFDLLPLATIYDSTGIVRFGATENYFGQISGNWTGTLFNNINAKHADCDGSGQIGNNDVSVIENNYGVVHSKTIDTVGTIPLTITAPDTVSIGDTVEFKIALGNSTVLANNVYGLAYTFNINKEIINSSYVEVRFNDSWFTPDNNRLSFSKPFLKKGRIDIVQSRKNGINTTGEGDIGSIIIVIEEDLDEIAYGETVSLSNVRLIQNDITPVYVNNQSDFMVIISKIDGITGLENDFEYSLSPNPSNGKVNLDLNTISNYEIELINILGQTIYNETFKNKSKIELNLGKHKGMYILKVRNKNLESVQKLVLY